MGQSLSEIVRRLMKRREQPAESGTEPPAAAQPAQPEAAPEVAERRIDPLVWDAVERLGETLAEAITLLPEMPETLEGYRHDHQGRLVPIGSIRDSDLHRDQVVRVLALEAELVSAILRTFRARSLAALQELVREAGERYQVDLGGAKGNLSATSYDGRYRVQRTYRDLVSFSEEIEAAKKLIDQCLERWTEGANPHVRALIDRAFRTDRKGQLRTGPVLELLRLKIEDEPEWDRAMEALRDSIQIAGSAVYVRVYRRAGQSDVYLPVSLDLASAGG